MGIQSAGLPPGWHPLYQYLTVVTCTRLPKENVRTILKGKFHPMHWILKRMYRSLIWKKKLTSNLACFNRYLSCSNAGHIDIRGPWNKVAEGRESERERKKIEINKGDVYETRRNFIPLASVATLEFPSLLLPSLSLYIPQRHLSHWNASNHPRIMDSGINLRHC